ncbi:hypothetical protein DENSPDRAFT_927874 [Dentipellis sp. KUC8613]|nr:hypothetical protein DENSPDRAFT_927874 [Dentipellis sp. KUC8613]
MSAPPSPAMSATSSISLNTRRVHVRKGSMSAADPWGTHTELNMNPTLSSSCKLTIVRVNSPPPAHPLVLDEAPPSPQHRRHFGFGHSSLGHRRHGSNSSLGSNSSNKADAPRLSFASSSFAAPGSPGGSGSGQKDRPSSPTAFRSHSPTSGHRPSSSFSTSSRPRLTPDQLVNLARQATNPQASSSPAQSPYSPGNPPPPVLAGTSPASFTPLPDEIYLPFIDRPSEVKTLFSGPPSGRLLTLLAQTMTGGDKVEEDALFNTDPVRWLYPQLFYWLTQVDRDVAPDRVWVARARCCVMSHSELIWERIKGALGVPPELDTDAAAEDDGPVTIFTEFEFAHSPLDVAHPNSEGALPNEAASDRISPLPNTDYLSSSPPLLASGSPSGIYIEPVLAPSVDSPDMSVTDEHLLPPTRPGAHRMHNISEDVLEEKDEDAAEDANSLAVPPPTQSSVSAPPALATQPQPQVQGLRISTSPASPGLFATSPSAAPFHVPPHTLDDPAPARSRERDGSIGRYSFTAGGNSAPGYAGSAASSDVAYDAVAERGPGNPLFPSSFARLALGPTLSANNPQLRSPAPPPPPAFANPHAIRAGVRGRRGVPSWAESWDPSKHEYAVTVGSESSAGAIPA